MAHSPGPWTLDREQLFAEGFPVTIVDQGGQCTALVAGHEAEGEALIQAILSPDIALVVQRVEVGSPYRAVIVARPPRKSAECEITFGESRVCPLSMVHRLDGEAFRHLSRRFADARDAGRSIEVVELQGIAAA